MAQTNTDRTSYFPAIEKKYGLPMSYWFEQMKEIKDLKYPEQIAYLRENHGFSQSHANALVLYSRGSTSAKRVDSLNQYLAPFDEPKQAKVREILSVITKKYPTLETVIAWNQPMLKMGKAYVFGISVHTKHILIAPWGTGVLDEFRPRLEGYEVNKKTIKIPVDWKVDKKLLCDMVGASMAAISN